MKLFVPNIFVPIGVPLPLFVPSPSHDFIGDFTTSYRELARGQSQFNVYEVSNSRLFFFCVCSWDPKSLSLMIAVDLVSEASDISTVCLTSLLCFPLLSDSPLYGYPICPQSTYAFIHVPKKPRKLFHRFLMKDICKAWYAYPQAVIYPIKTILPTYFFSKLKIYFTSIITWMLMYIEMELLAGVWGRINRRTKNMESHHCLFSVLLMGRLKLSFYGTK